MATGSEPAQSEWESLSRYETLMREATLKHVDTMEVFSSPIRHADTTAITSTIKSSEEVVGEMKTWLRTGITPDGTRMMTDEVWQWHQDYYHGTGDEGGSNSMNVDYYYWHAPYRAHIGEIPLVMMHSQVNLSDGTHFAADRIRKRTKHMKNMELKAAKRLEVEARRDRVFIEEAGRYYRAHPLRKKGIISRVFG